MKGKDRVPVSCAGAALQRLDLSDNPMTEEVAPALAEALRRQSGLVRLNLNDTSLKDEGISAIAEVPCLQSHGCAALLSVLNEHLMVPVGPYEAAAGHQLHISST